MKKRLIINETERESILKLHNDRKKSLLKEQAAVPQPQAQTPTTGDSKRYCSANCPGPDTKSKCETGALRLQMKINDTCPSSKLPVKLKEDGDFGPASKRAIAACSSDVKAVPACPTLSGTPTQQVGTPETPTQPSGQQGVVQGQDVAQASQSFDSKEL